MHTSKIYPYVVPEGYLAFMPKPPEGFFRALGHNTYLSLVIDFDNICGCVTPDMLNEHGMSIDEAHQKAVLNLQKLATDESAIQKTAHKAPDGTQFVVWGSHWLAASCLVLPNLFSWARKTLGTDEILASVPERETMVLFPQKDRATRDRMRQLIAHVEKDPKKPITWELFSISGGEIKAIFD
ncbi:MAG TPA: hypothetical protein VKX17_23870 [Planctomycetota bacterium]|nr:hypothetical protein [Planctomycetota bacterium]